MSLRKDVLLNPPTWYGWTPVKRFFLEFHDAPFLESQDSERPRSLRRLISLVFAGWFRMTRVRRGLPLSMIGRPAQVGLFPRLERGFPLPVSLSLAVFTLFLLVL